MTNSERMESRISSGDADTSHGLRTEAVALMGDSKSLRPQSSVSQPQTLEFTNVYAKNNSLESLPATGGGCGVATPDCDTAKRFRPDSALTTPGARDWNDRSQQRRSQDVEVGPDGRYNVQRGDSLWTLGERLARGKDGQRPSDDRIRENMKRLTEANPEIKCNPNYLREGRKLVIPDTIPRDRVIQRPGSEVKPPSREGSLPDGRPPQEGRTAERPHRGGRTEGQHTPNARTPGEAPSVKPHIEGRQEKSPQPQTKKSLPAEFQNLPYIVTPKPIILP